MTAGAGPAPDPVTPEPVTHEPVTRESVMLRRLWLSVVAAVVGLAPFTIFSTFVVPIAAAASADEAMVAGLRGLGGSAALLVGLTVAPLLGRWPTRAVVTASLIGLAAGCVVATIGTVPAMIVFCLTVGAATSTLTPALLGGATAAYADHPGDAGRAATLITATQSLAAVGAAPVIGVIGWLGGWRTAMIITAVLALAVAVATALLRRSDAPTPATAIGYLEGVRRLRRRPDLLAVAGIATLRTTSFMGYLALLAVSIHDRFGIEAEWFTLIWTLSGASFFVGNYLAGRWARRATDPGSARPRWTIAAGLVTGTVAVGVVVTTLSFPLTLAAVVVMGFAHAVVAAQLTTLIAHHGRELTTVAFGVTAAGMSTGVFAGAVLGGLGLAWAGAPGLAVALALPPLVATALVRTATRGGSPQAQ